MRQGIFGGSFNPVHKGHLCMAREIMAAAPLDSIRFIPAAQPPHKQGALLAEAHHRVAMLELAISNEPDFLLDSRELLRGGTSYTVETLRELHGDFPNDDFFFIIGADSLRDLPNWFCIEEIARMTAFLVAARPGDAIEQATLAAAEIPGLRFEVMPTTPQDIASSTIRRSLQDDGAAPKGLHPAVLHYILERNLYLSA